MINNKVIESLVHKDKDREIIVELRRLGEEAVREAISVAMTTTGRLLPEMNQLMIPEYLS